MLTILALRQLRGNNSIEEELQAMKVNTACAPYQHLLQSHVCHVTPITIILYIAISACVVIYRMSWLRLRISPRLKYH